MQDSSFKLIAASLVLTLAFNIVGCGSGESKYIPADATAKDALVTALKAWQAGQPHGTISTSPVPIDTYDARWQAGSKLESFEIVREEMIDNRKGFVVKMKLADNDEEQEVTYLVIGIDPLMVFRKQDYDKASAVGGGD